MTLSGYQADVIPNEGSWLTIFIDKSWPYKDAWLRLRPPGFQRDRVTFAFAEELDESGFTEASQPNYSPTEIIGRAESFQTFTGTANRTIGITIQLQAQGLEEGLPIAETLRREVYWPGLWLAALQYPFTEPESRLSHAPPPVFVQIGELFLQRSVVTNATPTWMPPYDTSTLLPHRANVQCEFTATDTGFENYVGGLRRDGGRFLGGAGSADISNPQPTRTVRAT